MLFIFKDEFECIRIEQQTKLKSKDNISSLMSSLRESYDMMDKLPSEGERRNVQNQIASKVAALSPSILRDLFENPLPKKLMLWHTLPATHFI